MEYIIYICTTIYIYHDNITQHDYSVMYVKKKHIQTMIYIISAIRYCSRVDHGASESTSAIVTA